MPVRRILALLALLALAAVRAGAAADPPEGFGATALGGAGGRAITVTTLADAGPGSLREALAATGPRIVQFAVEGTIVLQTRLRVSDGRITIDGATATGQGITLLNHGIQFREGCDDIIIRNLRIRVTTGGADGDCLLFWGNQGAMVERALVDHCSLMWATDEVVNNVIYNWGVNNGAKIETGARVNLVNNTFIAGPQTSPTKGCIFPADPDLGTRIYAAGNVGPFTPTGAEDQWLNVTWYEPSGASWIERRPAPEIFHAAASFPAAAIAATAPAEAYAAVLDRAGAAVRDADDLRVIAAVKNRAGREAAVDQRRWSPLR